MYAIHYNNSETRLGHFFVIKKISVLDTNPVALHFTVTILYVGNK